MHCFAFGGIQVLLGLISLMGEQPWGLPGKVGHPGSKRHKGLRCGTHGAPPSCNLPGPSTVIKHSVECEPAVPVWTCQGSRGTTEAEGEAVGSPRAGADWARWVCGV